jgi:hypothetical protein
MIHGMADFMMIQHHSDLQKCKKHVSLNTHDTEIYLQLNVGHTFKKDIDR